MSGNNLSRDEARERSSLVRVDSTEVELDLTAGESTFSSTSTIRFHCSEPGAGTFVDLLGPRVVRATLNGVPLDTSGFTGFRLPVSGLAADNELHVVAECSYTNTGEGLHRFVDPVDGAVYLYTQFETYDAHRMYACFDQPDLKTTFTLSVTAPDDWEVVSNQPEAHRRPAGDGVAQWRFTTSPRVSTYITALIAGPYHVERSSYDGRGGTIDLGIYCRSSLAQFLDADELFLVTRQGFGFFEEVFDRPYPFDKYDQLFVPEFNAGAMENFGAVTFLEDYVFRSRVTDASYERRGDTILHEMAHMWFGDLVTMRWWDDLWLNESFASYMAVLAQAEATRWTNAWATFANVEKTWAYRQDQLPTTHPIAADIVDVEAVEVNFDGITYAKGASVLKQLVAYVGREEFFSGLRVYFDRHAWGNTSLQDLLSVLEDASGRDLAAWSKEWLEEAGVNTIRAEFAIGEDGRYTSFALLQEAVEEHPTLRTHRLAVGLYDEVEGRLARRSRFETDIAGSRTELPDLVGERAADFVLVNDDDLTYCKIRLDEASLQTAIRLIEGLDSAVARAVLWAAAWDMTRDAEMRALDYVRLVVAGIAQETDIGLLQVGLRQAALAMTAWMDPEQEAAGLAMITDKAREEMRQAAPGSDQQLIWVRAWSSAARRPGDVDEIRALLEGSVTLEGLAVDADLRWHLLHCLVALGAAGDAEIAAELERDATAAGQRHAATARALRPTPEAKAEAWRLAVEDDSLPNQVSLAVIRGFGHPAQRHLLEPYRARYFGQVADVWERRSNEVAQNVVLGLYPSLLADEATLRETDDYLAGADLPAALRRLIVENRDTLARAVRNQRYNAVP